MADWLDVSSMRSNQRILVVSESIVSAIRTRGYGLKMVSTYRDVYSNGPRFDNAVYEWIAKSTLPGYRTVKPQTTNGDTESKRIRFWTNRI